MQIAAILWHVSLLAPEGQKGLALGLVGLVRVGPIIVFSLISGVVADTFYRKRLLLATQTAMGVIAAILALTTFVGNTLIWPLYLLTGLSAVGASFASPARNALLPMLVPRKHLPNALSLMINMFQVASVLGPALGGMIIGTLGLAWAYTFNAVSYLAVIVALLLMRDIPVAEAGDRQGINRGAMLEGLRFVFSRPLIRSTMLLDFFATLFSSATALLPIFAQDILHVGAQGYGLLSSAPALGAVLAGAAMVPLTNRIKHRGKVLLWAVTGYGMATILFGLSRVFWLTFVALALSGMSDSVSTVLRQIIRHLTTPDRLRGRMTSVNMIFYMGGPQLGEVEAGLVANWFGAPFAVVTGGIACILATIWVAARSPALRGYRHDDASVLAQPATGD